MIQHFQYTVRYCMDRFFSPLSRFDETPATEAIRYARLSCSEQLLNDVICIWLIDKDIYLR